MFTCTGKSDTLTCWILFGDTYEPHHYSGLQLQYSFNIGMQISHKKKAEYHLKLYQKQWIFFLQKIRT